MNSQLPLAFRFPPDQRFDSYLGAAAAIAALRALAGGAAGLPHLLVGPAGSGKTHLLLAACAEAQAQGRRALYLPLASLRGRLAQALEGLAADLVCLDELDAVAGAREDEVALFHAHNRLRAEGGNLLYAARGNPQALGLVLPDLGSRLGQCTRLHLDLLDDEGRRALLRQRASRRGLVLDEPVLDYLLRRVGRDPAGLARLFERLDRESLAAQRRITIPFLRGLLGSDG